MKILVTGGAGNIGSHVVLALMDAGHQVVIIDNFSTGLHENVDPRAKVIEGDISNAIDIKNALANKIDVIFHFAAWKAAGESMTDPAKYASNNICGTISLLNAMLENGVKYIVFSSSAAVYGNPQYLPIDEQHSLNPVNYYGYTKKVIEENLQWYSRLKGIHYAALRYFNATGYDIKGRIKGKEKKPANLSPIVLEVAAGIYPRMSVFGTNYQTSDGSCIRDYIHVSDLASAHLLSMNHIMAKQENLTINLGTGKGYSVFEVIHAAEKVTGRKIVYDRVQRREGDPPVLIASSGLARKLLGWNPRFSDLETIFQSMCPLYISG